MLETVGEAIGLRVALENKVAIPGIDFSIDTLRKVLDTADKTYGAARKKLQELWGDIPIKIKELAEIFTRKIHQEAQSLMQAAGFDDDYFPYLDGPNLRQVNDFRAKLDEIISCFTSLLQLPTAAKSGDQMQRAISYRPEYVAKADSDALPAANYRDGHYQVRIHHFDGTARDAIMKFQTNDIFRRTGNTVLLADMPTDGSLTYSSRQVPTSDISSISFNTTGAIYPPPIKRGEPYTIETLAKYGFKLPRITQNESLGRDDSVPQKVTIVYTDGREEDARLLEVDQNNATLLDVTSSS